MPAEPAPTPDEILRRAAELGPRDRAAYIRKACGSDTALFQSVLDRVSAAWLRELTDEPTSTGEEIAEAAATHGPGDRIGPYQVLRELGRGGMGEVYLCERADEQFRSRWPSSSSAAAVLSRQVQTRLRTERQILATLDHPNIARLLDGGTTADGRPLPGAWSTSRASRSTTYCDDSPAQHRRSGCELFRAVCSAVAVRPPAT